MKLAKVILLYKAGEKNGSQWHSVCVSIVNVMLCMCELHELVANEFPHQGLIKLSYLILEAVFFYCNVGFIRNASSTVCLFVDQLIRHSGPDRDISKAICWIAKTLIQILLVLS